jgi:hypothetical protein
LFSRDESKSLVFQQDKLTVDEKVEGGVLEMGIVERRRGEGVKRGQSFREGRMKSPAT